MKAGDVMTTGAATVKPSTSLAEAARLMIEHRISGLVSRGNPRDERRGQ